MRPCIPRKRHAPVSVPNLRGYGRTRVLYHRSGRGIILVLSGGHARTIAEELGKAFNSRLSLGTSTDTAKRFDDVLPPYTPQITPAWSKSLPTIDVGWVTDSPEDFLESSRLVHEADGTNPVFAKRNIVTDTGQNGQTPFHDNQIYSADSMSRNDFS